MLIALEYKTQCGRGAGAQRALDTGLRAAALEDSSTAEERNLQGMVCAAMELGALYSEQRHLNP